MVRLVVGLAVAAMLAGCGGGAADAPTPSRTPAAAGTAQSAPAASKAPAQAAELAFLQRQGEGGATQDTVSVRIDGTATYDRRHGGAGGRFKELELRACKSGGDRLRGLATRSASSSSG